MCWGEGRVVLIGDAAHGMSPNMAQGAALAFEDALALASSIPCIPHTTGPWIASGYVTGVDQRRSMHVVNAELGFTPARRHRRAGGW